LHDLNQAALWKSAILPSSRGAGVTTSITGVSMDMIEGDGMCHLISNMVFFSGTGGPTFDSKVQESTDGTTWTDITGAALTQITTAATTGAIAPQIIQFQRTKRYLRTVNVVGGTTSPLYVGDLSVIEQKKTIYQ
jgi:hypothetical protein